MTKNKNSKVNVYDLEGKFLRVESAEGKILQNEQEQTLCNSNGNLAHVKRLQQEQTLIEYELEPEALEDMSEYGMNVKPNYDYQDKINNDIKELEAWLNKREGWRC